MQASTEQNYWPAFVDALSNVVLTLVFVLVIFVFALAIVSNKAEQKLDVLKNQSQDHQAEITATETENQQLKQQVKTLKEQVDKIQITSSEQTEKLQTQLKTETQNLSQALAQAKAEAQTQAEARKKAEAEIQAQAEARKKAEAEAQMLKQAQAARPAKPPASEDTTPRLETKDLEIKIDNHKNTISTAGSVSISKDSNMVTLEFPVAVVRMDDNSQNHLSSVLQTLASVMGEHKIILKSYMGDETYSMARRMAYYRAINARNFLISKMGELSENISLQIVSSLTPGPGRVEIILQKK